MAMLAAAWKAGVRAAEAPSSPPPEDEAEVYAAAHLFRASCSGHLVTS